MTKMKRTKKFIILTAVMAVMTGVGVGIAEIERTLWQTRFINGIISAINHVLFWPIFALNITPGSTLDTPWFFVPLMVPVLGVWAWFIVIVTEKMKRR